jgi:23S rRNA G2069 N7-methylase RlmK/C1962 C5-methylase RlmI
MSDAVVGKALRRCADAVARLGDGGIPTTCIRLFSGRADGCDGVLVDRLGALVVATDYRAPVPAARPGGQGDSARRLLELVQGVYGDVPIVVKARGHEKGSESFVCIRSLPSLLAPPDQPAAAPLAGPAPTPAPLLGLERGMRFEIGTDPAHDFGIFLDAGKARQHVRDLARGLDVLNLFSYAAAFGVAAAVGGAASVTNVDPNRDYLAWGLRNAALNQVALRVLPDTAQDFLRKHARRMARDPAKKGFDLVILDPPAFGVGRGRDRLMRLLWPELFAALRGMRPTHIVLLCNDKYLRARRDFVDFVQAELGADYQLARLGTCFRIDELAAAAAPGSVPPPLDWRPDRPEDPFYVEPVVLAARLR